MSLANWSMLVCLALLWGGSFILQHIALAGLPVLTLVALRVGLAAACLLVAMSATGRKMPAGWRIWGALAVMGLVNNAIPFGLIVWGQTQISAALAAILNATTPLFTVLVAHMATEDERLTRRAVLALVLGLAGVAVIVGPAALGEIGAAVPAQLAVLGAACSYGCAAVWGRRFRGAGLAPMAAAAGQLVASSLLLWPAALALDRPWSLPWPPAEVVGAVLALALLSTALAYILYFRILASAGATNLSLVTLLVPVSALLLSAAIFGTWPGWRALAGLAVILAALALLDGRLLRASRRGLAAARRQAHRR